MRCGFFFLDALVLRIPSTSTWRQNTLAGTSESKDNPPIISFRALCIWEKVSQRGLGHHPFSTTSALSCANHHAPRTAFGGLHASEELGPELLRGEAAVRHHACQAGADPGREPRLQGETERNGKKILEPPKNIWEAFLGVFFCFSLFASWLFGFLAFLLFWFLGFLSEAFG